MQIASHIYLILINQRAAEKTKKRICQFVNYFDKSLMLHNFENFSLIYHAINLDDAIYYKNIKK